MKIVCFGDSLTACGGENGRFSDILADRFHHHTFVNRGAGGESFVEGRERLHTDVLAERPDIVLVEFGANDWWRDERPPADWARDLEACIQEIQDAGARVVVLGVFGDLLGADGQRIPKTEKTDDRARAYQRMEAETATRHGCPYVPNIQERIIGDRCCWRDANHPNEYGNRYVADAIEPVLEELLGDAPRPVRKPTLHTTRDIWQEAAALGSDRPAVVDGRRRMTYGQAYLAVERLAAGLHQAVQRPAPKVAIWLPNCLEYYLLYWAVQRLGGVVVPLNTWLKEESLRGIFANVQPDVLIVGSARDAPVLRAAGEAPAVRIFALETDRTGPPAYRQLLGGKGDAPAVDLAEDALSIIMHTSGTTAAPKGAMMRHSDLRFNLVATINAQDFQPSDVHLLVNPMFHCTALYSSLPAAAYQKAPVVIVHSTSPEPLMETLQNERITTFLSVPSVFQRILSLKDLAAYDASSLRLMAYAGSPMPVATVQELRRRFPEVALHNFFGLTETISATHVLKGEAVDEHPDSIGRLLPFVEAKIVDEGGMECPAGAVGELLFARENVIPGYYNQPGRLEESLVERDGRQWFCTGDYACADEEGFFYIKGRKKDMIIVGGENVFAGEVESVLATHPGVREAAVKGVPARGARAFLGEQIRAYVIRSDTSLTGADVRKHCYERLPSYKVPQDVVFLEALPRNPAGKVVKAELP